MSDKSKKILFVAVAAAFFILPWVVPAVLGSKFVFVRNYAPGAAVIAGMIFALVLGNPFSKFTGRISSQLLGVSIVLMGFGMDLKAVLAAGASGFACTCVGIIMGLGLGYIFGRALKINKNCAWLVSVGTSICGGSAIAAAAPALKAKAGDIALASATVFTLNAIALLIFPLLGRWLGFTENEFGYFAALAIHDTSSVVGATLQYGAQALEVGTTVKLARALWIVPVTLFIAAFVTDRAEGETKQFKAKVPWFIPGFLLAAALVTYLPQLFSGVALIGEITALGGGLLKEISKYLMILTLFMIGANLSREKLRELGIKPLIHGVLLWLVLSVVWCLAIHFKLIDIQ